jgi:hypothetical protein
MSATGASAGGGASYNFGGDRQVTVGVSGNVDDNTKIGFSVGPGSVGLSMTKKVTKTVYIESGIEYEKEE